MITRSADHHYTYDGVTYPGVTGILKIIDKSGPLMSWAARQTAEAVLDLMKYDVMLDIGVGTGSVAWSPAGVIQLLDSVGPEGFVKAVTARSSWKRDEAAALGTEVHDLADMVVRGQPTPAMNETTRKRVLAYAEWWKASGWTLRTSEAMVVSPKGGYGGTLDLLAYDRDGRTVLADIKTGKGVYNETILQLTAYGTADFIQAQPVDLATKPAVFAMPAIDRHVILHVTADAVREIEVNVGHAEHIAWLACIELARWRETVKGKRL